MDDKQYYANVTGIIDELLKNAAHSFGIDFQRLNMTGIETTQRLLATHNIEKLEVDALAELFKAGKVGWYEMDGKDVRIYLEPRPSYCDRGNWYAKVDYLPAADRYGITLDSQDGWPRYYYEFDVALSELKAWLVKRGQWVEGAKWSHHTLAESKEEDMGGGLA